MGFFDMFTKASKTASVIGFSSTGRTSWMSRDAKTFADEGYKRNIIGFTCVNLIATAAASVPWYLVSDTEKKPQNKDLQKLLLTPNPTTQWSDLIHELVAHRLIAGNSYLEAVTLDTRQTVAELYVQRPDLMSVIPGPGGIPKQYEWRENNGTPIVWPVDPITGQSDILHLKKFNPLDTWLGMSPMEAAAYSIDQHSAASKHNKSLLDNGVTPSGAVVNENGDLTQQQYTDLQKEFANHHRGAKNAGKPLFLQGMFKWIPMSMTPKEIDWVKGKDLSAREVGLAYNVPSQLLGIEGSQKYANYEQAMLYFWEYAVIPELRAVMTGINRFLRPKIAGMDRVSLAYDLDQISALVPLRSQKWDQMNKGKAGGLITVNEAREALGYPPIDGGDEIYAPAGQLPLSYEIDREEVMATDDDADKPKK